MPKKISFSIKILIIFLLLVPNNFASELRIIPLKKPLLNIALTEESVSRGIIKPKSKPKEDKIEPKEEIVKYVKKKDEKIKFLLPKNKPLLVKKETIKSKKSSKFYKQKDFNLAKKSIQEFEKGKWTNALKLSKKAKDRSIYNFIQWKHLLTTGNQANFYDYQLFINKMKITQELIELDI